MISQLLLRFGLALVFGWFGIDKFIHPEYWMQFLPGFLPLADSVAITVIGAVEIFIAVLLLSRLFKVGAAVAAVELAFIISLVSVTEGVSLVAVRDAGLMFMALGLLVYRGHVELARAMIHERLRRPRRASKRS